MMHFSVPLCFLFFSNPLSSLFFFFFFNDTATTEIYTLSLHDALPILFPNSRTPLQCLVMTRSPARGIPFRDRKSTRLNSSHSQISYAVFCLKKKKKNIVNHQLIARRIKNVQRTHRIVVPDAVSYVTLC